MSASSWLIVSLDVGGVGDPAALVVLHVRREDRLTRAKMLQLDLKPPVVTPQMHVEFVEKVISDVLTAVGPRAPLRLAVDISNNSAIATLLAQAMPRNSLIGAKITNSDQHGAGVTPFLIGDVGGKATSIPMLTLSRRQLLLDIGSAFSTKQLTLPLDDPAQQKILHQLKVQMSRASLKVTPAGRQIAVVQRGHDDLLMALAQGWAVTKLPAPRDPAAMARPPGRDHVAPSAIGWT